MAAAPTGNAWTDSSTFNNQGASEGGNADANLDNGRPSTLHQQRGGGNRTQHPQQQQQQQQSEKKNVLLLGLDGSGKTRLSLLLGRSGAFVDESLAIVVRPTASLSGACIKAAEHEGKGTSVGLASSESTGVGAATLIHESHFYAGNTDAEWENQNSTNNPSSNPLAASSVGGRSSTVATGPLAAQQGRNQAQQQAFQQQQQVDRVSLKDCSGAARFRYRWRQYYSQDWLTAMGGNHAKRKRRFCHGIIYAINAHDSLRVPMAWSELCTIVRDLHGLSREYSDRTRSGGPTEVVDQSNDVEGGDPLEDSLPILVLVVQHHHVPGGGTSSNGSGYHAPQPLTAATVLKMVEDHRPFPQGSRVTVANADFSNPATARNSCKGVARWCHALESQGSANVE